MSACVEDVQNTQSQQPGEKRCNFASDKGDAVVLPWPPVDLQTAQISRNDTVMQMDPTGF